MTIDERETGLRNLVNFGHTIGHAIEAVLTPTILHGECISVGMILEGEISRQMGILSQVGVGRLNRCLKAYNLPVTLADPRIASLPAAKLLTVERILDIMRIDKKNSGPEKKIVILSRIGATYEPKATVVPDSIIAKTLSEAAKVIPGVPRHHPVKMATPGSKSISNRALVLAALGKGTCRLKNLLHSDDTQVMMAALNELKVYINEIDGIDLISIPGRKLCMGRRRRDTCRQGWPGFAISAAQRKRAIPRQRRNCCSFLNDGLHTCSVFATRRCGVHSHYGKRKDETASHWSACSCTASKWQQNRLFGV